MIYEQPSEILVCLGVILLLNFSKWLKNIVAFMISCICLFGCWENVDKGDDFRLSLEFF